MQDVDQTLTVRVAICLTVLADNTEGCSRGSDPRIEVYDDHDSALPLVASLGSVISYCRITLTDAPTCFKR